MCEGEVFMKTCVMSITSGPAVFQHLDADVKAVQTGAPG